MATYEMDSDALVFPHRERTRLRISLRTPDSDGSLSMSHNTIISADDGSLEGSLRAAQQEVVEQEIFSVLIREAGNLPTASARVSERLIVIDAAQGMELLFELVR
jgi:mediator of RNA polymerase II transcription subunit 17, fungi type